MPSFRSFSLEKGQVLVVLEGPEIIDTFRVTKLYVIDRIARRGLDFPGKCSNAFTDVSPH